ncbi:MAG: threonylcarbamoyl-AMP synthase [Bacteroidetes bacterium RIFOXYA12_FULL_35_11]|nr:MAG: threonylcarbamoyl-AMP synthase [Bacteroidetes bacterium GWF2_35_48]OFY72921.1 MAG: threonylcarbamoyl-AMP synthase [Bacteroidetes bacterium RIFOXYA12_FULL_35_11]OFY99743.1 MAG: threonylcarbamoyl-AMP synthase [Bacteroidetes bacterium RIFOXYC12_FULL_35_7]HBX51962.1 threonylcarbamoyl-AMP synthase [Bacteroidales bacterium]
MVEDINNAVEVLKKGGVILYPTDTVWGLGCDATNAEAVKKIYLLKKREESKSMILFADSLKMIEQYVETVPDIATQLIEVNDKPMTIIFQDAIFLPDNLIAEDKSIAFRIPNDIFCQSILRKFRRPIVSTSANISGGNAPFIFSEISKEIIAGADYVVKWRQDDRTKREASQIIKLSAKGEIMIVRK